MTPFRVSSTIVDLAVSTDGTAVVRIGLAERADRDPETEFEMAVSRELQEYFRGERRTFSFAVKPEGTKFQLGVWCELQRIPYGQTVTYGEIACRVGDGNASRAVGGANNRNPIPIVIPCHRVVAAAGKLGGFGGGIELKKGLLDLETTHSLGQS